MHVKVVKVQGEFVWHVHDDTDEFFLVHRGRLTIQLRSNGQPQGDGSRGNDEVHLEAGDMFVVPKGVEHRPVAIEECEIVLMEPVGVVNTGDTPDSELTAPEQWI